MKTQRLDRDHALLADELAPVSSPGRAPVTARLSPRQVVFRAADPEIARAFDDAAGRGRPRTPIARGAAPVPAIDPFAVHLPVSSPGDAAEREADRAADAMVAGTTARVGASSGIARKPDIEVASGIKGTNGKDSAAALEACKATKASFDAACAALEAMKIARRPVITEEVGLMIKDAAKTGVGQDATQTVQRDLLAVNDARNKIKTGHERMQSADLRVRSATAHLDAVGKRIVLEINAAQQDAAKKSWAATLAKGLSAAVQFSIPELAKLAFVKYGEKKAGAEKWNPEGEDLGTGLNMQVSSQEDDAVTCIVDSLTGLGQVKQALQSEAQELAAAIFKDEMTAVDLDLRAAQLDLQAAADDIHAGCVALPIAQGLLRTDFPKMTAALDSKSGIAEFGDLAKDDAAAKAVRRAADAYVDDLRKAKQECLEAAEGSQEAKDAERAAAMTKLADEQQAEIDRAIKARKDAVEVEGLLAGKLNDAFSYAQAGATPGPPGLPAP